METNISDGLNDLWNKLNRWVIDSITMLPNILIAAIVLILGLFIAKKIKLFLEKKLGNHFPTKTLANLTINTVYVFLIIVIIFSVLQTLHFSKAIDKALAGVGILALGLSFAFQEIAANFISGIILAFDKPFIINEIIRVKDLEGFVVHVNLKDTTIKTYQGQLIAIPNKDIFTSPVINYTRLGKRRADIRGSVCKTNNLQEVKKIALTALNTVSGVITENTNFLYKEMDGDTIFYVAEIWINSGNFDEYKTFLSDGIIALDEAFKANDVAVPDDEYTIDLNENTEKVIRSFLGDKPSK